MFSRHAARRCAQRGIRPALLAAVLEHADVERSAGGGCRLERVSRAQARALNLDDRLGRLAVILSDRTAEVVTVMPLHRHSRMARRQA